MSVTRRALVINGFSIYWYGVLIAISCALAVWAALRREDELGIHKDTSLDLALIVLPCGFVGARLYYALMHRELFNSLYDFVNLRSGGLAIYGGLIAGVLAGLVYACIKRLSFVRLCDLVLPCVALSQAIGRWGNFLNQEAYGVLISAPALQFFPVSVYIEADAAWHAATFFYESAWCLLIYLVICVLPSRRRFTKPGAGALAYIMLYSLERAAVEGLRLDSLYLGPARASQLLSACLLAGCGAYLLWKSRANAVSKLLHAASALFMLLSALALLPPAVLYLCLPVQAACGGIGFARVYFGGRPAPDAA